MKERYGFVYIWFDKKHKRFYVGCHWGNESDGYICSSRWMRQSYRRRPDDFKRRVLTRIYSNRYDLLLEEGKWLQMIPEDLLGKRYYNLTNYVNGHWTTDPNKRLTIGQKIAKANKGRISPTKGVPLSEEHKQKLSVYWKGKPKDYIRSEETRIKISTNSKRLQAEGRIGMSGKQHSEATKQKMSLNNAMKDPINRQKIEDAKKGIRWLINGTIKKMAIPGTKKFDDLIDIGYKVMG